MHLHVLNGELSFVNHCFFFIVIVGVFEFKRITTMHLQSKFFSELDALSANLLKVYAKKGGAQGRKIKSIMVSITQV